MKVAFRVAANESLQFRDLLSPENVPGPRPDGALSPRYLERVSRAVKGSTPVSQVLLADMPAEGSR